MNILGAAIETVAFDVPDGGEGFLFTAEPDGQVAVVIARADEGFAADLATASGFLGRVLEGLG